MKTKPYVMKLTAYTSRPTWEYSGTMRVIADDDAEFERLVHAFNDDTLPADQALVSEKWRGDPYAAGGLYIGIDSITAPDGRDLTATHKVRLMAG